MTPSKVFQNSLPPIILACSLFAVYLNTLAPGLTWANGGSDGGDLISAAATGGVAHPTGYPLYLLIARLFQVLPAGSLAFRTNLLSAVTFSLAAALVSILVTSSSSGSDHVRDWPAGLAAGYAFGLAPLVWSQAVITEVYGLQALLLAIILYLYALPAPGLLSSRKRLDRWRGLVLGLATGNHVTTLLLIPAVLFTGSVHQHPEEAPHPGMASPGNLKIDWVSLCRQLAWFGAGLSLYLTLPLRALSNPPVNWGNAVTPERFWWLVSGQLYQSHYLGLVEPEIWVRIQARAALLFEQFGFLGLALGIGGLTLGRMPWRLYMLTAWTAASSAAFAVVYFPANSNAYLIPTVLSIAIWAGFTLQGLSRQLARRSTIVRLGLCLLFIGYLAGRSIALVSEVDGSRDRRAESFGREVLSSAPDNAIVFAKGDRALFALWYFHFALGERADLAILATDLLHFDWYAETLRSTYPALVIPGPFPWPETIGSANSSRAVCHARYSDRAELDCSLPLP